MLRKKLHTDCLCVSNIEWHTERERDNFGQSFGIFAVVFDWDLCTVILIAANVCPIQRTKQTILDVLTPDDIKILMETEDEVSY